MKPQQGGNRGQVGAVAWLCSVSGGPRGWRGGANPEDSHFLPGLQAEAPDVAALGRQRSFNPRLGTHVNRAPLLLKAPTQGQPWVHTGGGTPRGVEARTGVTWAWQDGSLTRLHNALV